MNLTIKDPELREKTEYVLSLDLVVFLSRLGYEPVKTNELTGRYSYASMIRPDDSTPSFSVRRGNDYDKWVDFGKGEKGGQNIINLARILFDMEKSPYSKVLDKIIEVSKGKSEYLADIQRPKEWEAKKYEVSYMKVLPMDDETARTYCDQEKRLIDYGVAMQHLEKIYYEYNYKKEKHRRMGVGMKNESGEYHIEILSKYTKQGNDKYLLGHRHDVIANINNRENPQINLFESQSDFLAMKSIEKCYPGFLDGSGLSLENSIVCSSVNYVSKLIGFLNSERGNCFVRLNCFFDNDLAGESLLLTVRNEFRGKEILNYTENLKSEALVKEVPLIGKEKCKDVNDLLCILRKLDGSGRISEFQENFRILSEEKEAATQKVLGL